MDYKIPADLLQKVINFISANHLHKDVHQLISQLMALEKVEIKSNENEEISTKKG